MAPILSYPSRKFMFKAMGALGVSVGTFIYAIDSSVSAYEWKLHPPSFPWSHNGPISILDHSSLRRGYEVYKNVCSTCHSMDFMNFRKLVNVTHTLEEAKALAAEAQVKDGPDDTGEYFMRPGKLIDFFPAPYANEEAAKAANNGALPPDLSQIILGRHGGEDYVFSLLTGYTDPPAGVIMPENGNYNRYFEGSVIGMIPPLYNNVIEYEDGTPATLSQLAKDVCTFLRWVSEPYHDKRKQFVLKCNVFFSIFLVFMFYINKHKWVTLKTRAVQMKELGGSKFKTFKQE